VQNSKPEMSFLFIIAFTLVSAFLLSKYLSKRQTRNLPGGSLGYPLIGETLSFLGAQRGDRGSDWLEERISKHGLVFKTSLMGSPTVVIIGQAGNKFVYLVLKMMFLLPSNLSPSQPLLESKTYLNSQVPGTKTVHQTC
jgi:hypothetical protein